VFADYRSAGDRSDGGGPVDHSVFDLLTKRPAWMANALCRDPAYRHINWFPERGQPTREAKQVCSRCLVRDECSEYGRKERYGIWGGEAERGRRKLRRTEPAVTTPPRVRKPPKANRAAALIAERRDLIALLYADGMRPREIQRACHLPSGLVERELTKAGVKRWQRAS
jgi:WhiB family redox-sensing transcriptional regulator